METLWDRYKCTEFLANLNIDLTQDADVKTMSHGVLHGPSYIVKDGQLLSYRMYKSGLIIGLDIQTLNGECVGVYGQYGDLIASEEICGNYRSIEENGITRTTQGDRVTETSVDFRRIYIDGVLVSETNHNGRLFDDRIIKLEGQCIDGLLEGTVTCEGRYDNLENRHKNRIAVLDALHIAKKLPCNRSDTIRVVMTYLLGMLHGETQIFINGEFYGICEYVNNVKKGKGVKPPKKRPNISKVYHEENNLIYKTAKEWIYNRECTRVMVGNKLHGTDDYHGLPGNNYFGILHGAVGGYHYKYGRLHGECRERGLVSNYHEGLLHGPFEKYNGDKLLYSLNYEHGKLNGECKVWYPNGNLCEESYLVNGEKIGNYKLCDEEGNVTERISAKSARS